MNRREARQLANEDPTPYGVLSSGKSGFGLILVTGYRNARIVAGEEDIILTESEIIKVRKGWRP